MLEKDNNAHIKRNIAIFYITFSIIFITSSIISYNLASSALRKQFLTRLQAIAATMAVAVEQDSDSYQEFLKTLDTDTDYYRYIKDLMMRLRQVNEDNVTFIYTIARAGEDSIVYILSGESPHSELHTAPGFIAPITDAARIAFDEQRTVLGENFVDTDFGRRLSAYVPIFHRETGAFLGLAAADINDIKYYEVMNIFVFQTALSLVIAIAVFAMVMWLLNIAVKRAVKYEAQTLSLQKKLAQEGYEQVKNHLNQVGGLKHEIKNHIAALHLLIKGGQYREAESYLEKYAAHAVPIAETVYHENFLINAAVNNLIQKADEYGVTVELNLKTAPISIADHDFYSLLANMLENALEACAGVPEGGERFIRLSIISREPYLNIRCENSRSGEIIDTGGEIRSSKAESGHGYGLWTIRRIVDAYDGIMDIDCGENTFTLTAALKDQ